MPEKENEDSLTLDKRTMDVIVANIIPTSKYFEIRFDHMQDQIDRVDGNLRDFRADVGGRFETVDKRFDAMKTDMDKRFDGIKTDMDKRFEQVDKRFEQVDKRLDQIIASIDRLGDKLDHRDENQRSFTLRMFTIAISISILGVLGVFLRSLGVI